MIDPTSTRLRRSLLFVPGADQRKVERARGTVADTVLLDLEDAVPPEQKDAARENVAAALRAGMFGEIEVAVRVNAFRTPHFASDLSAVVDAGGRTVLLPKAENATDLLLVYSILESLLRGSAGRSEVRSDDRVKLLLLVESPIGVANALSLGRAVKIVEALCFGHADFCLEMGLTEADASRGVAFHARCSVAIAAKAAGVTPIDCVHLAVKDEAAFRVDAELGRSLGFEGKLCIHPRQAEIANEIYTPAPQEIEHALRIIEAAERAEAEGRGAFALDGKMIDAPLVQLQRRILERARRAGVLPPTR